VTGNLTAASNDLLSATAAGEAITVSGNIDFSAAGDNLAEFTSTFTTSGANTTLNAPEETFYTLVVNKAGAANTTTLNSNLTVSKELRFDVQGVLAAGAFTINFQGDTWRNNVGAAAFNGGTGLVDFVPPVAITISIYGSTTFNNFRCLVPGVVILFEKLQTQTIDGVLLLQGAAGNFIDLDAIGANPGAAYGYPPPPPVQPDQWIITMTGTATLSFVRVQQSYATIAITPDPTCEILPSIDPFGWNWNWYFFIPIQASWTVDADNNGRIDRIRVLVLPGTRLSDSFGKLVANVEGYSLRAVVPPFSTGAQAGDSVFDILLQESLYLDSEARPRWQLLSNDPLDPPGLFGIVGGAYVRSGTIWYTPDDGARPVIAYTLAVANQSKAYLHFSEPVYSQNTATGQITDTDFDDSGGRTFSLEAQELTGDGAHAAMLTFNAPVLSEAEVLPGGLGVFARSAEVWDPPYSVDPGTYHNPPGFVNLTGDNFLAAVGSPNESMLNSTSTPAVANHPVTDVGLGLVEPVYALSVGPTTAIDPVRGGAGRITRFDGSAWLQDRNTQLQANIQGLLDGGLAGPTMDLYFDVNPGVGLAPGDPTFLQRLWIPNAASTLFGSVPPGPDRLNNGKPARQSPQLTSVDPLRDYEIDSTDSEIRDGADLEFLFLVDTGAGYLFPLARVDDPLDPRTARPWSWKVRDLRAQRGEVTILNNVINPLRGEKTGLYYSLSNAGYVTITVFDLKGDIVNVLYRGQRAAGEYSTTWDGRNRGGRVVARGLYFIKVVGPDVNEIRKVLVVK